MKDLFYFWLFTTICCLGTTTCKEDLKLNLPEPDDKIIIDGWIDDGQFARVLLTRNSAYFSTIDSAFIRELVLTRAKVTLSDGETSEILILRKNTKYFPPYIFEGNEIIGDTGKTYTLTAEYGGKTAWASTTIPGAVKLDTAYFKLDPESDSLGTIHVEFRDPPGVKNYYRILTMRIGKDLRYYSAMIMAMDDALFSGQKFGFSLSRGPDFFISSAGNKYFKLGDSVSIKFCTIDKLQYDFWKSFQNEVLNTSNPFASSLSTIKSPVQGDGLGIWGGYGVSYYTLKIK
jgi:hypothetical protein